MHMHPASSPEYMQAARDACMNSEKWRHASQPAILRPAHGLYCSWLELWSDTPDHNDLLDPIDLLCPTQRKGRVRIMQDDCVAL